MTCKNKDLSSLDTDKFQKRMQTDECFQCLYVETGYRPQRKSFTYYAKSVFTANNEALNFWTHFIPFLLMLRRLLQLMSDNDDGHATINVVLYIHATGVCFVLLVSSVAHMFCSHSPLANRVCFTFDCAAINIHGATVPIAFEHFLCPIKCYGIVDGITSSNYLQSMTLFSSVLFGLVCISLHPSTKYFAIVRNVGYAVSFYFINAPCVFRYVFRDMMMAGSSPDECFHLGAASRAYTLLQFCVIYAAGFFYTFRIPERFYPGRFDIIGHSHQIFHVLSACGIFIQNFLIENIVQEAKQKIESGLLHEDNLGIRWENTVGQIISVVVTTHGIAMFFCIFVYAKISCSSKPHKNQTE